MRHSSCAQFYHTGRLSLPCFQGNRLFVPTEDGGFFILGSTVHLDNRLDGIRWGGDEVLEQTMLNLSGLDFKRHPSRTIDIDTQRDFIEVAKREDSVRELYLRYYDSDI